MSVRDGLLVRTLRTKKHIDEQTDSLTEMTQVPETEEEEKSTPDTLIYQQIPLPSFDDTHFITTSKSKKPSWNISLVYNGQMGRGDNYLAAASIGKGSFNAASNTFIPMQFNNWIDYNAYLNYASTVTHDAETRSIMNIAMLNSSVNGGVM